MNNNVGKFCSVTTHNAVTFGLIVFEKDNKVKILILKDDHPNRSLQYKTGSIQSFNSESVRSIKPCWN